MPFTDQEIQDKAAQLVTAGTDADTVKRFVQAAKAEQQSPAAMLRAASESQQAAPPAGDMSGASGMLRAAAVGDNAAFGKAMLNGAANMGLRGGGPALGQALGAFPPLAIATYGASVPIGGAIGGMGGEALAQLREGKIRPGAIAGAGVAGAVPMSPLAGAGVRVVGREMLKQGAGNLAATVTENAIDQQRLPSPREAFLSAGFGAAAPVVAKGLDAGTRMAGVAADKLRTAISDENLLRGIHEGYVLTPTALATAMRKPTAGSVNTVMESIGGLAKIGAQASLENQNVTNKLVTRGLGLPPGTPLVRSEPVMGIVGTAEKIRDAAATPYKVISEMSDQAKADLATLQNKNRLTAQNDHELAILMSDPKVVKETADLALKAGADVNALKFARFEAKQKFDLAMSKGGDPELLKEYRAFRATAEELEDKIEKAAVKIGQPELLQQLKDSRKKIAVSYVVDNALGHDGNVSAPVLGRMLDIGVPLTDELRLIAKFEQTVGRVMRESSKVASPTGDALRAAMSAGGATAGALARNPGLAIAGAALPYAAPYAARKAIFSQPYQNAFLQPRSLATAEGPDLLAQFARFSTEAAGRQPNSFMKFLEKEFPRKPSQDDQAPVRLPFTVPK